MILNDPETKNKQFLVKTINNQYVKINDLKVQFQDKLHVINELKHLLAQKSQKTQCELPVVDSRIQKKEDENVSLAFQLRAQLKGKFSESQMNHNGTSVNTKLSKPSTLGTKLYSVTLFPKLKVIPKVVEKNDLSKSVTSHLTTNKIIEKCTKVLALGLVKIETELINTYFKNNRAMHRDYLKVTKEHIATLLYGHPFNPPNIAFVINSVIPEQSSWNFRFLDFRNSIMGYGDLQMGNILISRVYYVKGLGYNLFSVGQSCDSDLEVAFRKQTCFVRNLEGVDLLSGSRVSNLYIISMADIMKSSPICLLFKASKMKSWLWHHRLSHLNFGTINKLAKQGLVKGLPKLKYTKDHLCSACLMGKSKKESHPHKPEPSTNKKLQMLHMDLCGSMRVESINKKRYILSSLMIILVLLG
ncbi:retrovirus-related pol polyprotein from transposon TNT 1-94 [Tanacetum coccineum]|uniref:Retrovirus-related pol polyprotein from transposon TNT 1-94 n=1 Tax=Tanacetum coccineum TaxID=301880 RepID=A0ABQ5FB60_9ASTR